MKTIELNTEFLVSENIDWNDVRKREIIQGVAYAKKKISINDLTLNCNDITERVSYL